MTEEEAVVIGLEEDRVVVVLIWCSRRFDVGGWLRYPNDCPAGGGALTKWLKQPWHFIPPSIDARQTRDDTMETLSDTTIMEMVCCPLRLLELDEIPFCSRVWRHACEAQNFQNSVQKLFCTYVHRARNLCPSEHKPKRKRFFLFPPTNPGQKAIASPTVSARLFCTPFTSKPLTWWYTYHERLCLRGL